MRVLFTVIDRRHTDQVVRIYHEETNGFCMELWGRGTAPTAIMDYLCLGNSEKAVIIGIAKNSEVKNIFDRLKEQLRITEKGTGVSFSVPINSIGKSSLEYLEENLAKFKELRKNEVESNGK